MYRLCTAAGAGAAMRSHPRPRATAYLSPPTTTLRFRPRFTKYLLVFIHVISDLEPERDAVAHAPASYTLRPPAQHTCVKNERFARLLGYAHLLPGAVWTGPAVTCRLSSQCADASNDQLTTVVCSEIKLSRWL